MTLGLIARRSLRQHALSTVVTAASIALGAGLLMAVWVVKEQARATFAGVNSGIDFRIDPLDHEPHGGGDVSDPAE